MPANSDAPPGISNPALSLILALACTLSIALSSPPAATQERGGPPIVRVGIVLDAPQVEDEPVFIYEHRGDLLDLIKAETIAVTRRDFDVRFPETKLVAGDATVAGIRAAIDGLLADPDVDLVVSLGPIATNDLVRRRELPKPVVAAWALDVEAQRLPFVRNTSGVKNLSYVVARGSILRDLRKFQEVAPLETVHVLVDVRFAEAIPEIPEMVTPAAEQLGLELITVPVGRSAQEALDAIPEDTDGVYITPLQMVGSETTLLIRGLNRRRIPTFSFLGQQEVARGVLAGSRTATELPRLGRRIALNIQRILMGEDAGTLPVTLDQPEKLTINMATARAINVFPSWRVLTEAVQLYPEDVQEGRPLRFDEAVREAVRRNLSLRAFERTVAAGAENVGQARSALLPGIESFARGVQIDADRAESSFGMTAEQTGTVGLSLSQLLYSDAARARLRISRKVQQALEWEERIERLDIALAAALAYLDVLRAQTLLRVAVDNVRLTESHLDLAVQREELGVSGPADVYRWESELATDRIALIEADNRMRAARVVINRLLNRPQEEPFRTTSPTLEEPWLVTCCQRVQPYVDNPALYAVFREFMVREGLANAVELEAIDAAIAAQERSRLAARRSFWSPDVGLRGDVDRDFARSGAGSGAGAGPFLPGGVDRESWSISLQATLPLTRGGARSAELRQSTKELSALRLERQALAETIELRIRAGLFAAGTTYPAIELAQEAANAARRNLDLVTDAYSRGVVSIIDLLDAQNAALAAEQFAANAVYDFLVDLMEVQRATNTFDFFRSDEERDAWFDRLREFFVRAGMDVGPPGR